VKTELKGKEKYFVASVSFGKDSVWMLEVILRNLWKYPLNLVIFVNTGFEFDGLYEVRDQVVMVMAKRVNHYDLLFGDSDSPCTEMHWEDATPDEWDEGIAESEAMLMYYSDLARENPDVPCYKEEVKFWRGFITGQKRAKAEALANMKTKREALVS